MRNKPDQTADALNPDVIQKPKSWGMRTMRQFRWLALTALLSATPLSQATAAENPANSAAVPEKEETAQGETEDNSDGSKPEETPNTPPKKIEKAIDLDQASKQLADLINATRKKLGLPEIAISHSLMKVAKVHVNDLETNAPINDVCGLNSWSDHGKWSACCYTTDHARAKCMWDKPKELTKYPHKAYEIPAFSGKKMTPEQALKIWQEDPAYFSVIKSESPWDSEPWEAMGVGISDHFAAAWFGRAVDDTPETSDEEVPPAEAPKVLDFNVSENADRAKALEEGYTALGKKLRVSTQDAKRDYTLLISGFENGKKDLTARVLPKKKTSSTPADATSEPQKKADDKKTEAQPKAIVAEKPATKVVPPQPASTSVAEPPKEEAPAQTTEPAAKPASSLPILSSMLSPDDLKALEAAPSLPKNKVRPFVGIAQNIKILPKVIDPKANEKILNVFCNNKKLISLVEKVLEKANSAPVSNLSSEAKEKLEQIGPYLDLAKQNRATLPPVINQLIDKGMNWILENPQSLLDLIQEANQNK